MIDWKRFAILTTLRTIVTAGVTTGLCFLFPPALPFIIGGNIAALVAISGGQIIHAKHNGFSDTPDEDLDFCKTQEASKLQKVEAKIVDKVEECFYNFEEKKDKRKDKKQEKSMDR